MSSFNRRHFLISAAALSGCGFTPAYGPGGAANALRGSVTVDAPNNRNEFDLVTHLERRLGQAQTDRYQLSYKLSTSQEGVGVTPQQEIIRYNLVGKVTFTLRDTRTNAILTNGSVDTFTSYSVRALDVSAMPPRTNSTVSTIAATRDAYSRLMVALGDQLVARLVATSPDWAK